MAFQPGKRDFRWTDKLAQKLQMFNLYRIVPDFIQYFVWNYIYSYKAFFLKISLISLYPVVLNEKRNVTFFPIEPIK